MESLYILIPIAVIFLAVAIKAFLWAADHRQFDDLDQEARRILFDEQPPPAGNTSATDNSAATNPIPPTKTTPAKPAADQPPS